MHGVCVVLNLAFVVSPNKATAEPPQRDPSPPGEAPSLGAAGEVSWASAP